MTIALERIRTIRGMTKRVAEACDISQSTVSEWSEVPVRHITTVARVLDISPAEVRPDLAEIFGDA